MSRKVTFVLNRPEFRKQVLKSEGAEKILRAYAESAKPSGNTITVESDEVATRVRVRIWDRSFRAMFREAREGHLSRAIGVVAGDRKIWYTTKAGKRRLATVAQVENWTRGSRKK